MLATPMTRPAISPALTTDPLRHAAQKLETAFIAEMLRSVRFGEERQAFGGGSGAAQFGSFLIDAQAERLSAAGGIGLAESLYRAMGGTGHG